MKNDWKPNAEQRCVLEALDKASAGNRSEFCERYGNAAIGTPAKLSQILDALEENKGSYFNKIEDAEGLMKDLTDFMDELPAMIARGAQVPDGSVHALSTFKAVDIAARECREKNNPERCIQYIAPTGGSKSFLYPYLAKKLKNEFTIAFVNCRDAWRPATRDLRQRSKLIVLKDLCVGLRVRLREELRGFRNDDAPAIEDALVENLGKRKVIVFIEEGRFLSSYALNLFIDLLNRTWIVLINTSTPYASACWHRYYPDEADQLDRRTHAVIRVSKVIPSDAALFFGDQKFENKDAALKVIAESASEFGHYSLISRMPKFLKRTEVAGEQDVKDAITKAAREVNRGTKFQPTAK